VFNFTPFCISMIKDCLNYCTCQSEKYPKSSFKSPAKNHSGISSLTDVAVNLLFGTRYQPGSFLLVLLLKIIFWFLVAFFC
jgi:hypothetical protein